ncbi:MAG: class I SAM-dependent methyltransferase [Mucilaginibacter sp.]
MITPNYSSYRDPAARVVKKQDGWYRYVFKSYQKEYDYLTQSGLYHELVEKGLMISHEEIVPDTENPDVYKVIKPDQITFQSYPFEWSYSQWRKALIALLDINTIALKYGMILKDASPFNFYITKGRAVLLDTTSFILFTKNDLWVAYRQFCEEFLGPLTLMHYNGDQWSELVAAYTRGLPLAFISRQLRRSSWFNLTCLLHIHLHARFRGSAAKPRKGFTAEKLQSLFSMIRSTALSWSEPYRLRGTWKDYYDGGSPKYIIEKEKTVIKWLDEIKPHTVADLGANTGRFAFIAAKYAGYVIAIDKDENCIDSIEDEIEEKSVANITALTVDLAEPSPARGVLNKEYRSIFDRGKSDTVLGLALAHHLCIDMNISMQLVAETFSAFCERFAIVEFVPPDDERVVQLIANRGGLFTGYNEELFITAFSAEFDQVEEVEIGDSKRKLFLFKKRHSPTV